MGRAADNDLVLVGDDVSREHAELTLAGGAVTIADRGSHGGTRVNGELIGGSCQLLSGDVITIGAVTLVLHSAAPAPARRQLHDLPAFRQRLGEEIDRALRYERPLHLLALDLGTADWARLTQSRATTALALDSELRAIDVAGQSGESHLFVAVPELQRDAVHELATRLLTTLAPLAPDAKAGLASVPADAADQPALLAAARAAMAAAAAHEVRDAADCVTRIELGTHHIVLADPAMLRTHELIRRIGKSDLSVLLLGETGAG
jgi:hypothetical protein